MAESTANLISTLSLKNLVDLTRRNFLPAMGMVETRAMDLFIKDVVPKGYGNTKLHQEIDVGTFGNIKREGADAQKKRVGLGYTKTVTAKRIAAEVDITWEMREYRRDAEVISTFTDLYHFCPQRMELDATHILTFAASTSYTDMDGETVTVSGGDSLAPVYATHTLAFSDDTYTNVIANNPQFSQGALEIGEKVFSTQILNNFGQKRVLRASHLYCADNPVVERAMRQVMQSTADVDTNNSGIINTFKGKYQIVVLPYLASSADGSYDSTKENYWGLIAATGSIKNRAQIYMTVFEEPNLKTPATGNNGEDFHNDNWSFGVRSSYTVDVVCAKGLASSMAT